MNKRGDAALPQDMPKIPHRFFTVRFDSHSPQAASVWVYFKIEAAAV
jgi:hypothetical protein